MACGSSPAVAETHDRLLKGMRIAARSTRKGGDSPEAPMGARIATNYLAEDARPTFLHQPINGRGGAPFPALCQLKGRVGPDVSCQDPVQRLSTLWITDITP